MRYAGDMNAPNRLSQLGCFTVASLALACSGPAAPPSMPTNTGATASAMTTAQPAPASLPSSEKRPVSDAYHGTTVVDDYRWLEDWSAPAVKAWSKAQNGHARATLDQLPAAAPIRARLSEIFGAEAASYSDVQHQGGQLFALKTQPPKQQPMLVRLPSADAVDKAVVVVDPNTLDAKGTTSIDWFKPSFDGKLVAVSLSKGGTERGDLHVYDTQTGKQVHEVIRGVNGGTAGGSMAWDKDGRGLFYSRYPRKGERADEDMNFYVQTYHHAFGQDPAKDDYELGKAFPRIAEIELIMHAPSGRLLCTVQDGDGGEFSHHLREPNGRWRTFSKFGDRTLQAAFGRKNDLYLLSRAGAPRGKILHLDIRTLDVSNAKTIIAESKDTIVGSFWRAPSILATPTKLYVQYQLGGPSEIRLFDHRGKRLAGPTQPPVSAASGLTALEGDSVLFETKSFVEPPAYYRFDAARTTGQPKTKKTAMAANAPVDMSAIKVVREMATSKDGTKIPVNILLPPGAKLDGKTPCVVNGYGGYGINLAPRYRPYYNVLLEQGVIYAVANLRGGGEYGEQWHLQGNLTHKQNVFDDFAAVLEHMVARKYTASDRLAIIGGSNGGLLMGATMTQRPALATAVVSFVGIYDMLRVELSPNGAFNVPEFGTVKNPAHFKAMYAYSPYHRVEDGVAYPATLMLTGENDPRVDPMQSRKMVARLQAATSSQEPILLRTSSSAGHGGNNSLTERISQITDAYAFLMKELGVNYQASGQSVAADGKQ